ncbi:MAG: HAD-IIIC family phosphatase [Synergistaceae bacterium]|nr:HAD-IIIC family phosphatase [Synergistaceae bacterium]
MTQDRESAPITILANFTAESLALRLQGEGLCVRTAPGFDTWRTELLHASHTGQTPGEIVLLLLHGPALFPDGIGEGLATLDEALDIVRGATAARPDRTLIVSTLDLPRPPASPLVGRGLAARAAAHWRAALEEMDVPIFDLASIVAEVGRKDLYNAKTWYLGALPFSASGERRIAEEIVRVVDILRRGRRKCLVLDLDGTLWGGVIGEDGIEGIALSDHGIGAAYRDVQVVAKALKDQGVLLAICSKNDIEDALLPFREHPHTVLRPEDFAAVRANWSPKPKNVADIARELNIDMGSMIFIDDSPVEREAVRAACPDVEVPDFPSDTSALPAFLRDVADRWLTVTQLSVEDAGKTEMYRAEAKRNEARASHVSLDGYLASLEMRLDLHALRDDEVPRAAQLCAKTNQFNLTTRRHDEAALRGMMGDGRHALWIASLKDRFGDYGRIALIVAEWDGKDRATFDTFLMSCRAMGRGVEAAALSAVEADLALRGVTCLTGRYVPTAKNDPVKDFWRDMGYARDDEEGETWTLHAPFPERRTCVCLAS